MLADVEWCVYILRCGDGSLYTGITNDLPKRLEAHRAGTGSRYTRARLPVEVVYHEASEDRSSASKREAEIKRMTRERKIALLSASGRTRRRVRRKSGARPRSRAVRTRSKGNA